MPGPFDHLSADIQPDSGPPIPDISFHKKACSAPDIQEFPVLRESIQDIRAQVGIIASSPAFIIMVVIYISNGVVVLLDFFLPDGTHLKTSCEPGRKCPYLDKFVVSVLQTIFGVCKRNCECRGDYIPVA